MFARFLLFLLLAAFSLPAAAASCHDAPSTPQAHAMSMHEHHRPAPQPDAPLATHACVGCVPPSDLLGTRIVPPALAPAPAPTARVASLDLGGTSPPDLPPPRRN